MNINLEIKISNEMVCDRYVWCDYRIIKNGQDYISGSIRHPYTRQHTKEEIEFDIEYHLFNIITKECFKNMLTP